MTFIWPIGDPIITRDFYYLSSIYVGGQHAALDLIPRGRPATGEPLRAVADGLVAGVGWDFYSGFFVAIDHDGGWRSIYRHLYGQTPVSQEQRISRGQIIGNVGNTGYSLGAHLHFDLWNRNKVRDDGAIFYKNGWYAVDPELYLGQEADDMAGFDDEQKAYLADYGARLARGIAWALAEGGMNTEMKRGDPGWKPPHDLGEVLIAITGLSSGSGLRITDAQLTRVLTPIVRKALEDMATKAGGASR